MNAPGEDIQALKRQLEKTRRELEEAHRRERESAFLDLVDLVDDCDRAIDLMHSSRDNNKILVGVEQLRKRAIQRFNEVGLKPYGEVGDTFDPKVHEAISTEPGYAPDNSVVRVHRRGWMRADEKVARTAMVTVCKGTPDEIPNRRRDPRRGSADSSYVCPYGYEGCQGDCPSCKLQAQIGAE